MSDFKARLPEVKFNKNGYEIRTEVLKLASVSVWKDYYARWDQYSTSVTNEGDESITARRTRHKRSSGGC